MSYSQPDPHSRTAQRPSAPPSFGIRALAAFATLFGLLTLAVGGRVLFGPALGDGGARQAAGAVVPFVLWFNFLAGFAYVAAGAGLWLGARWAVWLALGIAAGTAAVGAAFAVHVAGGGAYEARTAVALTFRATVWALIAWLALRRPSARP